MANEYIYQEIVQSNKTEAIFLTLIVLFLLQLVWRFCTRELDFLWGVFTFLFFMFLFTR